jgi:hypothetical protein
MLLPILFFSYSTALKYTWFVVLLPPLWDHCALAPHRYYRDHTWLFKVCLLSDWIYASLAWFRYFSPRIVSYASMCLYFTFFQPPRYKGRIYVHSKSLLCGYLPTSSHQTFYRKLSLYTISQLRKRAFLMLLRAPHHLLLSSDLLRESQVGQQRSHEESSAQDLSSDQKL